MLLDHLGSSLDVVEHSGSPLDIADHVGSLDVDYHLGSSVVIVDHVGSSVDVLGSSWIILIKNGLHFESL